jgi:hypothetical protein
MLLSPVFPLKFGFDTTRPIICYCDSVFLTQDNFL